MQQVVDEAGLDWLDTPDQAVVWGTALGLQGQIEDVLDRSLEDLKQGTAAGSSLYFPAWYQTSDGSSFANAGVAGSGASLFSDSGDARPRRDDVGARHDRQLAVIVRQWRRRRLQRRFVRRWRRRRGRRLLGDRRAASGPRRYTQAMGAVETMEDFFEKLNGGDRAGAVALMDEQTEMRVHVGDSVQMLRGVERVGGWFLRGEPGLRMIPGDIRDTGNTYEADVLVVRPGAPTTHIEATFRVEAGKITAINIAPR